MPTHGPRQSASDLRKLFSSSGRPRRKFALGLLRARDQSSYGGAHVAHATLFFFFFEPPLIPIRRPVGTRHPILLGPRTMGFSLYLGTAICPPSARVLIHVQKRADYQCA